MRPRPAQHEVRRAVGRSIKKLQLLQRTQSHAAAASGGGSACISQPPADAAAVAVTLLSHEQFVTAANPF